MEDYERIDMQNVDGKWLEIVEFDTMPELPITGLTESEAKYENLLRRLSNGFRNCLLVKPTQGNYAAALTAAIETGVITEPGKYGIEIYYHHDQAMWNVYKIIEE